MINTQQKSKIKTDKCCKNKKATESINKWEKELEAEKAEKERLQREVATLNKIIESSNSSSGISLENTPNSNYFTPPQPLELFAIGLSSGRINSETV